LCRFVQFCRVQQCFNEILVITWYVKAISFKIFDWLWTNTFWDFSFNFHLQSYKQFFIISIRVFERCILRFQKSISSQKTWDLTLLHTSSPHLFVYVYQSHPCLSLTRFCSATVAPLTFQANTSFTGIGLDFSTLTSPPREGCPYYIQYIVIFD
jgi:hypothetical protein